jgi:hypothetical protein
MRELIFEVGHKKFYFKGNKFYAPVVRFGNGVKYLRRSAKTAIAAEENARQAMARYQRLLNCTPKPEPAS